MSDDQNPFGVGRGDRTVIRPNPAGRRPVPPGQSPFASASAPRATPSPSADPTKPPSAGTDDWVATYPAPQPAAASVGKPLPLRIDQLVSANENPIMRAAGPLLLLLGGLRVALLRAPFASLMEQVAEAIKFFENDIRMAGVPEDQAMSAKYVLCATADDIVQNIPTDDRHVWTQYSMLSRFFGERIGGVRFFEELDRAKADPLRNYSLLELMHACLALGFQGIHRTSAGGQAVLQQIQRDLYEVLRRVRPKVVSDLSPRWQGQALASRTSRIHVPVWAVAGILGVLVLGLYLGLRTLLGGGTEAAAQTMLTLHSASPVELRARAVFKTPPPPQAAQVVPRPIRITQIQRIRAALANEIKAGQLSAEQTASHIIVRVGDLVMFESGRATAREEFKPIAQRIAEALDKEPGQIRVVGHSDSTPIRTVRFQDNWHLSVERAKAVAALLQPNLANPDRVETAGRGAEAPIASNNTAEGRARNRRVEVMIPRAD